MAKGLKIGNRVRLEKPLNFTPKSQEIKTVYRTLRQAISGAWSSYQRQAAQSLLTLTVNEC